MNIEQKIQYEYELLDCVIELDQRSPIVQQAYHKIMQRVLALERAATDFQQKNEGKKNR